MIGMLLGAGLSLAGTAIGAAKTAAANRAARRAANQSLDRQAARNENMYNYSLGTPRYATQTILNQTADVLRDRKAAREGAKNVIGGTQASVQAGNQQDVEMLNNATQTGISQGLDDRRQALQNYTEAQNNIDDKRADVEIGYQQGVANQTAQAVQGVASAAGNIAGALDGVGAGSSSQGGSTAKTAGNTTSSDPTKIAAPTVAPPTIQGKVAEASKLTMNPTQYSQTKDPFAEQAKAMGMGKVEKQGAAALKSVPKTNMTGGDPFKAKALNMGMGKVKSIGSNLVKTPQLKKPTFNSVADLFKKKRGGI